jgi:transposase
MSTLFFDRVPDYTRINRRIRQLSVNTIEKINREITKARTRGKSLEIIMDGTGVQINGKYVWMDVRKKGKKIRKRDWRKLHIAIDIETGNIDDTASIIRAFLDGAYDGEDNFDMLEYLGIDPVIRTRKPSREKAERMSRALKTKKREKFFSKLCNRVALLQHVWDRYVEVKGFGKRGGIEGVIGSFKRTFGERLFSKIDDMIHREILLRVLVWNIMH